jgi:acetyl esterase/lipase
MLRTLLSLPTPALRLMSGGGVVYRGGRTLDPRLQFLAARARQTPSPAAITPEEMRKAVRAGFQATNGRLEPGVRVENLSIDGPRGAIPLRTYRSATQAAEAPVLVWAHQGGGVTGDLETSHAFCSVLARVARCPVLSVDYRLAPEHRFPAGLEDVLAAFRWARDNAPHFGAPPGETAIGGDSMGGNFAAAVCQELKRTGEPQPALQLLVYPAVDGASETASMTTYADAFPLTATLLAWFIAHYVGPSDSPSDPRLSPLRGADLSGLAPAVIATAGFDPLVDQGEAYARALRAAGVPTTYRCYDALCHGFASMGGVVPAADLACREIAELVRDTWQGRSS